jgi:glycerol-3-phosphate dehydrogenase
VNIGIVGGGINGLCAAWMMAERGHRVTVYERDKIMNATSRASSKLLHGGLRYLENGEFRLVREALRERSAWLTRAPHLAKPLRMVIPIYKHASRSRWLIAVGLSFYDLFGARGGLPRTKRLSAAEMLNRDPGLNPEGLIEGFEFSDGQMDDYALGNWVAEQAISKGVEIQENTEVLSVTPEAVVTVPDRTIQHGELFNMSGPWAIDLLNRSGLRCEYTMDLVRGSHLVLSQATSQAYLLEAPQDRRAFFVLPWKRRTLIGSTEVRQSLDEHVCCNAEEAGYLLGAYRAYFPSVIPEIAQTFSGIRPLVKSATDPTKATREHAICRHRRLTTVVGGKWTTSMALARKLTEALH